jgi:acyl-coenzyme A synthetase/AMP-(fatty) acid ligase
MSCFYEVDGNNIIDESIPIGQPFPNVDVFLVTDGRRITEPGKQGIIYIRGVGISAGYYDDEMKTNEVFVQNPLNNHYRDIVYNTGDIGMYNSHGELVYLYRNDFQIKRHGYRIELAEIEAAANSIEGIAIVCCVYSRLFDSIALYYCGRPEEKELTSSLKTLIPHYMRPNLVIKLGEMPRSDFHKIDRVELLKKTEELLNG